jgi:hypothetical protein
LYHYTAQNGGQKKPKIERIKLAKYPILAMRLMLVLRVGDARCDSKKKLSLTFLCYSIVYRII